MPLPPSLQPGPCFLLLTQSVMTSLQYLASVRLLLHKEERKKKKPLNLPFEARLRFNFQTPERIGLSSSLQALRYGSLCRKVTRATRERSRTNRSGPDGQSRWIPPANERIHPVWLSPSRESHLSYSTVFWFIYLFSYAGCDHQCEKCTRSRHGQEAHLPQQSGVSFFVCFFWVIFPSAAANVEEHRVGRSREISPGRLRGTIRARHPGTLSQPSTSYLGRKLPTVTFIMTLAAEFWKWQQVREHLWADGC